MYVSRDQRSLEESLQSCLKVFGGYELFIQEKGNEKEKPGVGNFIILTGEMTPRCTPPETLY